MQIEGIIIHEGAHLPPPKAEKDFIVSHRL